MKKKKKKYGYLPHKCVTEEDGQTTANFTKKFKRKKNFKAVLDPKVRIKYGHENSEEIIVDFTDLMKTLKELGMLKK
jgi:hypothetical protein